MRHWRADSGRSAPVVPRHLASGLLALIVLLSARTLQAQIMLATPLDASESAPPQQTGFTIPTDESLLNSFADFQRHVERKAWEKAFATLNEIPAEKRKGMLARPDGVIIPASQRIWDEISSLPAEGRDAFRLFHEAKARQTWSTIDQGSLSWSEQLATADKVYQEFFLSSVGDNAADFLGDAAFEQGDFETADRYWRNVLEKHPDSDIPELRLLFKRGLAAAQQGQVTAVSEITRTLTQRFAGQKVRVAGQDVDPTEYLRTRVRAQGSSSAASAQPSALTVAPAAGAEPAWRMQFLSTAAAEQRDSSLRGSWYYRNGAETIVPATATDGKRLYCNWLGIVFALDPQTGKLLWRSQKFSEMTPHFSNLPHSSANLEGYRIVAGQGIVIALLLPVDRLNYYQEPSRLLCLDAETGKPKWKSMEGSSGLENLGFVGTPLIGNDEILAIGHGRNESKLSLYCLDFAGKQKWTAELGTVRKRSTNSGYEKMPQPAMLKRGRTLFIATEDGALAAFDLPERKIRWTLPYGIADRSGSRQRIFYSGQSDDRTQLHTETVLLEHDGLLYVKEAGGRELLAIDPAAPAIVWRRPAEDSAQLVGVDDDNVYLLSKELLCINRKDRSLRWAANLPIMVGGLSIVSGERSILALTARGVFELSRDRGKVLSIFRGADLETGGGRLTFAADRLLSVTTQSVTSYAVPTAKREASP